MQSSNAALAQKLLAESIAAFYDDPLGFALFAFAWGEGELKGCSLDKWQCEFLDDIGRQCRKDPTRSIQMATVSGHGIGKSALTSILILWVMSTRPMLSGVVTANTGTQLSTKTWRELSVWHRRLINRDWFKWTATKFYHVAYPEAWSVAAIPNTEHNSEAFAGLHAEHVLQIYDEASNIPDKIWEVSEGAMTTPGAIWCVFGNPTRNTGRFRECFGKFKGRWTTRQIDSRSAKMTDKRKIAEWVEDYGEDSDFVRVRVKGQFPRSADSQFIPVDIVQAASLRHVEPSVFAMSPKVIGVDVARFGMDQSVIFRRQGVKLWEPKTWRGVDTMELASHVVDEARQFRPHAIFVDGTGVGGGVVDRLRQVAIPGIQVIDVQFGAQAADRRLYANVRAELWGRMREWLKGDVDIPNHPGLLDGLVQPEYGFNNRMQLQLERKEDMKGRGLASPDEADALAVTFAHCQLDIDDPARGYARHIRRATHAYA